MTYFKRAPSHREQEPRSGIFAKPIRTEEKAVVVDGEEMVMPVKIYHSTPSVQPKVHSICAALFVGSTMKPVRKSGT
jgi:hypothetical protein